MKSLLYLSDILTNTESVSLFSQANLDNSLKREYADIISRHIRYRYGRGAAAYFIFKVFQNLLAEIGFGATLEPNNVLYLSDYQIIHSIFFVV